MDESRMCGCGNTNYGPFGGDSCSLIIIIILLICCCGGNSGFGRGF